MDHDSLIYDFTDTSSYRATLAEKSKQSKQTTDQPSSSGLTKDSQLQSLLVGSKRLLNEEEKEQSLLTKSSQNQSNNFQQNANDNNSQQTNKFLQEQQNKRKKKCMRKAAETVWEDPTLEEWPDNDYRIFCGDLGNEVNDDVLANAFKKYASFVKARVVRDKKTMKSRGFGFVSLMNIDDYVKAMKEMQGKYIGNRPVRLKRSQWQDKSLIGGKSKLGAKEFIKKN